MEHQVVVVDMPMTSRQVQETIANATPGGWQLVALTADNGRYGDRLIMVFGTHTPPGSSPRPQREAGDETLRPELRTSDLTP